MDSRLIESLQDPAVYDHPVDRFELIETHISWVLLTGPYAYKVKKPVNLGFVDFTALDRRLFFCGEELRLNRRLAPDLYLDVVAIRGSERAPRIGGAGPVIEYAVKMKQFRQEERLDRVLQRGALEKGPVDTLAEELAGFYGCAAVAPDESPFGTSERIARPIRDNFKILRKLTGDAGELRRLGRLEDWSEADLEAHQEEFGRRKQNGSVRECHGDLHLENMILLSGRIVIFDCLEFNENFRWIDVMSDVAFLVMDLEHRGRPGLSRRFLNAYLEAGGDYGGLRVLRTYLVYRALVRAKVAAIRMKQQEDEGDREKRSRRDYLDYVGRAEQYTGPARGFLIATHGLSGSGKTYWAQSLAESLGAIRLRSDVERKRLYGFSPLARTDSGPGSGIYTEEAGRRAYERLRDLSRVVLQSGYPVIVDAAFLKRGQRDLIRGVAREMGVPFVLLDVTAPPTVLRERIAERRLENRDASEADRAVLERQIAAEEPLAPEERPEAVVVETEGTVDPAGLAARLERLAHAHKRS